MNDDGDVGLVYQLLTYQLRTNMERCRDTLTEAANWNQLVRDVNAKFESGELNQLTDKLQAMKHSLKVLEHMPEVSIDHLQL